MNSLFLSVLIIVVGVLLGLGIAALIIVPATKRKGRFGINLKQFCSNCQEAELLTGRKPSLFGGWTCSKCGGKYDKWGKPIYSPKQIFLGSFVGGPIAAVYFLRKNFLTLENDAAASQTLLFGIIFNIAFISLMIVLPKNFPNFVVPLGYCLVAQSISQSMQFKKESMTASSEFHFESNGKLVGIALAYFLATCALWILIFMALAQLQILNS